MDNNTSSEVQKKKKVIRDCIDKFNLPDNPVITEVISIYPNFPNKPSKKLAILIITYKREATTTELKKISDQPAALIRNLRNEGFLFQDNGKTPPMYLYKDKNGETCRKIIGFQLPKVIIKGKVKAIIEKSVAACISAIEIYNKPDFKYREETFSILLVNAWELLLKAKILSDNNSQMSSIQVIGQNGKVKRNSSGNPLTIGIDKAINKLVSAKKLDDRCRQNINLLIEIRDNAVHYINKATDFSKKVQEIGTASLKNYVTAINEWFDRDLSQYNFYLMPMSFFHPIEINSFSTSSQEKETAKMLEYFQKVETNYPSDENIPYNITLKIETKFVKSSSISPALEARYTEREDAPEVKISEEDIFKNKYPLSHADLINKLKNRYSDFKQDKRFHIIKKDLRTPEKHGVKFGRIRYLNTTDEKGSSQWFYSPEILKEFDKHYTRKKK